MGELGFTALVVGVVGAALSVPLAFVVRRWIAVAVSTLSVVALWAAVALLARALVKSDFSLAYVVDHSRETSSGAYRLAGLWGGMAGSLLLWTAILALIVLAASVSVTMTRPAHGVGFALVAAMGLIVVFAANPFTALEIPAISGAGLTPILEHPAMLVHPPVLYTGLLLTVVPFLLVIDGAASDGRAISAQSLARTARMAASVLALGLLLGSNWAYVELGWGGYWAWDPVENAALIPWLGLLVVVHAHRGEWVSPRLSGGFGMAPLILTMFGAWITRAGLTDSVHAFAEAPGVGLGFATVVASLLVVAVVAVRRLPTDEFPVSNRGLTAVASAIGGLAVLMTVLGTAYPVVRDVLIDDLIVVDGSYYSRSAWPLALIGLFVIALLIRPGSRAAAALGATVGVGVSVAIGVGIAAVLLVCAACAAVAASVFGLLVDRPRRWVHLGHLGFALLLVGVGATTATDRSVLSLQVGDYIEFSGQEIRLDEIRVVKISSDRQAVEAVLRVDDSSTLRPALVGFGDIGTVLPETDLLSTWSGDLQVVLRNATDDTALVEARDRPLVWLIWLGAVVMILALAVPRKLRDTSAAEQQLSNP